MPGIGTAPLATQMGTWSERGACVGAPVSERWAPATIFFADQGRDPVSRLEVVQAKGMCIACDSQAECLAWALDTRQDDGIWGGTTPKERRIILRRLRARAS